VHDGNRRRRVIVGQAGLCTVCRRGVRAGGRADGFARRRRGAADGPGACRDHRQGRV